VLDLHYPVQFFATLKETLLSLQYLKIFRYIDAVARTGSIRKAAETLFITASALDRRVQDLEQELGAELFERHARGMRLTAAGEIFVHHIRAQQADFARVRTEIEHHKGLRRGTVSVSASQAMAYSVLPEIMNRFRQSNPGVVFAINICDHSAVLKALREFEADIGVVYNIQKVSDITTLLEIEQRLCVVMSDTHPLATLDKIRMRDCIEYPLALPDASLGGRLLLEAFFAQSSLKPNTVLESNSFEMLRHFVRSNDALTFQIQIGTALDCAKDGVIARHVEEHGLARRPLSVVQLKGRPLPLPAIRFMDVLRDALLQLEAGVPVDSRRLHAL
jgi:DNA-binding transcriptional LysR family regulator